jgi:hypothetical protein
MNKRPLFLFGYTASLLCLSACSSIPFLGDTDKAENPNFKQSFFEEPQPVDSLQVRSELEDFKAMKSSLNRLVALESDLNFLLDEMSRFNEKNPVMYEQVEVASDKPNKAKPEIVFSVDGKTEQLRTEETADGWSKAAENMSDKWHSQPAERSSLRLANGTSSQTQTLTPTTNRANNNISAPSNVNQNKFSGNRQVDVAAAKPIMQVDQQTQIRPTQPTVNASKFSYGADPQQIVGDVGSCKEWKVDSVKTYSLHLASYKSRKAAEDGWNKLNSKYADVWCETEAKLAKVNVKGTEYLSLRVGGYNSRDKVLQLCSVVKEQGDYCAVTTTKGETL